MWENLKANLLFYHRKGIIHAMCFYCDKQLCSRCVWGEGCTHAREVIQVDECADVQSCV